MSSTASATGMCCPIAAPCSFSKSRFGPFFGRVSRSEANLSTHQMQACLACCAYGLVFVAFDDAFFT